MKRYCTYILCSQKNGTLYIGVTSDIARRVYEHQQNLISGFTKNYKVHLLVHVEEYSTMIDAIRREKQLKGWNRIWKIKLIEEKNPTWSDLSKFLL